mgnify:CR=1 FL=1
MVNSNRKNYLVTYKAISLSYESAFSIEAESLSSALMIAVDRAWTLSTELGSFVSIVLKKS